MRRAGLFVLFLFYSVYVNAGQLILKNGDVISGELKSIEGDFVVWKSDLLSEIKVSKAKIKDIATANEFKVRGEKSPCKWRQIKREKVKFDCEGDIKSVPLMSLKQLVHYSGHSAANYSYGGSLRASGWKQNGNTLTENWDVLSEIKLRYSDYRHIVSLAANSQSTRKRNPNPGEAVETSTRKELGSYVLDWFFLPQFYWSNKLSAESDDDRNIQEEYTFASGLGYQFWDSEATALSTETGLEYSRTYLKDNPTQDEPETNNSMRFASNFRYKFNSGLKFYHNNEFTRSLQSPEEGQAQRWEVRTESGVSFPIGFGISADFGLDWKYVNHAKDLDALASRTDSTYRAGVNYRW